MSVTSSTPLLHVHHFTQGALADVDFSLYPGDRLGILGKSGSGKTDVLRGLAKVTPIAAGQLFWQGADVTRRPRWRLGKLRHFVTLILANPYTALEPWHTVAHVLRTALGQTALRRRQDNVAALLAVCHLPLWFMDQRISALSGVERIRLSLVLGLLHNPHVVLVDDVFSAVIPEVRTELFAEMDTAVGVDRVLVIAARSREALTGMDQILSLDSQ